MNKSAGGGVGGRTGTSRREHAALLFFSVVVIEFSEKQLKGERDLF